MRRWRCRGVKIGATCGFLAEVCFLQSASYCRSTRPWSVSPRGKRRSCSGWLKSVSQVGKPYDPVNEKQGNTTAMQKKKKKKKKKERKKEKTSLVAEELT